MPKRRALGPLIALACLAIALALGLAACSSAPGGSDGSTSSGASASKTAAAHASTGKTLVIGYETYRPYCYLDEDGEPTGIDMDIAAEALRRMGYTPVFKQIDWLDRDRLLSEGEIDCIWCSYSMYGREDAYTWAGPYMHSDEVVVVPKSSSIERVADLEGKAVGVAATTVPERVFLDRTEPGTPDVEYVCSLEDSSLLYAELMKGYVDAISTHRLAARQYIDDYALDARILDEPLVHVSVGVAFAKGTDSPVPHKLDSAIKAMQKDGTIEEIVSRYVDDPQDYIEASHE